MLEKEVIQEVDVRNSPGFYSRIFTVPKKSGEFRPVIDLSPLNRTLVPKKFKMETVHAVRLSISPGDFATSLDLRDAYFHISMHRNTWRYLRFIWMGKIYHFVALPFGLSPAPYIFTMVSRELGIIARRNGIRLKLYIDDWLNLHRSREQCVMNTTSLIKLAQELGFNIKPEKSDFVPSTQFKYLGVTFDTVKFTAQPNPDRINNLTTLLTRLRTSQSTTYRILSSLLGMMESMSDLLPIARVHKRPLQREVADRIVDKDDFDQKVSLGQWFLDATLQWTNQEWLRSSVPIRPLNNIVYLHSDASTKGWGGHTEETTVSGLWNREESQSHINHLELESVFRCLQSLQEIFKDKHVIICGDNVTSLAYLRKQGGTVSRTLSLRAEEILIWTHNHHIQISTEFIPGQLNVLADELSRRNQVLATEWTISHSALEPVWRLWHKPMVDLFATKFNHRLPIYVSPMKDNAAWGRNAFAMTWNNIDGYAYPPTSQIQKVLAKASLEKPQLILVVPYWPSATWFPDLVALALEGPLFLNLTEKSLIQPRSGLSHKNPSFLNLTAWRI